MPYIHTECGGRIDTKTRTCTKCHKHWNLHAFWFSPSDIRPVVEKRDRPKGVPYRKGAGMKPTRVQYAGWGNKIPGVGTIASRLPNWPRWARILVTVAFIAVIVAIVLVVR